MTEERQEELNDLDELMSQPYGQRFICRLFERIRLFNPSFDIEPLIMAAREGEKNIGYKLLADLMEACPERCINLIRIYRDRCTKEAENAVHEME